MPGSGSEHQQLARIVRIVFSSVRVSFTVAVNYAMYELEG